MEVSNTNQRPATFTRMPAQRLLEQQIQSDNNDRKNWTFEHHKPSIFPGIFVLLNLLTKFAKASSTTMLS